MKRYHLIAVISALILLLFLPARMSYAGEHISFPSISTYGGKSVVLKGELVKPSGPGRHPLVILLHGCSGLTPAVEHSLRRHAKALKSVGFAAFILDSFDPRGIEGGWVCERISRLASARHYRQRDVRDAVKHLRSNDSVDTNNIFLVGQSNGGSVVTVMAGKNKAPKIRAAVAYYPWCGVLWDRSTAPILVLGGENDDWTPPEDCLARHNPSGGVSVHVYPGATHSFDLSIPETVYKGYRLKGDSKATADSHRRMIRFFKRYVK